MQLISAVPAHQRHCFCICQKQVFSGRGSISIVWSYGRGMSQNDADRKANSVDTDQTDPLEVVH